MMLPNDYCLICLNREREGCQDVDWIRLVMCLSFCKITIWGLDVLVKLDLLLSILRCFVWRFSKAVMAAAECLECVFVLFQSQKIMVEVVSEQVFVFILNILWPQDKYCINHDLFLLRQLNLSLVIIVVLFIKTCSCWIYFHAKELLLVVNLCSYSKIALSICLDC